MVAQDQDQDALTYGISGLYAYFFNVIRDTGEVKLANLLDYEVRASHVGRPPDGAGEVGRAPVGIQMGLTLVPFSLPAADALLVLHQHLCERQSQ